MDYIASPSSLPLEGEPRAIRLTNDYVRRLLVERHFIYGSLLNPGGSVILRNDAADTERGEEYSSAIGSSFHLDLIDLDNALREAIADGDITKEELQAILTWVDGMNSQQAAVYLGIPHGAVRIRKRRSRAINTLQERLNGGPTQDARGTGNGPPDGVRTPTEPLTPTRGDNRLATNEDHSPT